MSSFTPGRHSRYASPHNPSSSSFSPRGFPPRLMTPPIRGPSAARDRAASPSKSMDVDHSSRFSVEKDSRIEELHMFALSDTLSVRLGATLPIEMQQAFQAADPAKDVFIGSVHDVNGESHYAIVTTVQTCFVWKIDLNSSIQTPTCYMFPVPPANPSSLYLTVPFAALLPFGATREPGLILVSPSGEVRFWDSIGIGLAGAERFSTATIDLAEHETVESIAHIDATVYVVRTTTRLHRLTVVARPGTGRFGITVTPFNDPREYRTTSWLNPLRILQRRNLGWEGNMVAVVSSSPSTTASKANGRESYLRTGEEIPLWVLTSKNLMKWNVSLEGGERCEINYDIKELVTRAILDGDEMDSRFPLDVELLDAISDHSGNLTVLISHSPQDTDAALSQRPETAPPRVYALVHLRLSPDSESFAVVGDIEVLPYELASDPRHVSPPRLGLLEYSASDEIEVDDLQIYFSQFPDAFAFTSAAPPYQEQLHLKSGDDIILGFSIVKHVDDREVIMLTNRMVLVAQPNYENILKIKDDVHVGRANVLKSTILQAIKYGIKPENPLRFKLPSIADGESLKTASEQMSHALLVADSEVVLRSLSMGMQLSNRLNALQALVAFIGESGGIGKLSQSTREQLLSDAEKVAAARGLWDCYNKQTQKITQQSLLPVVIETYVSNVNFPHDGDFVRAFFNSQVQSINALIPHIASIVKSGLSSSEPPQAKIHIVYQANELVLALFTQAFKYRKENRPKYQIDASILLQPWTSEPILLAVLRQLFSMTAQFRSQDMEKFSGSEVFGDVNVQAELELQLRELASCLFIAYKDRLDFLDNRPSEGGGIERERNRLYEEFCSLRPEVLGHLGRFDSIDYAFQLAEAYRDFHALSELSYHPSAVKAIPAENRIRDYIQKFGREFTSELYKWYIEQGKVHSMFEQETEFEDHIDAFFVKHPLRRISWIHEIGKQAYHRAAHSLLGEAEEETNRETKHVMLSIGKLALMAEGPSATPQDKIEAFNNALDFMAVHDTLFEQFIEDLGNLVDFALESRVQTLTSTKCTVPTDRPALRDLFQRILRQLLHGGALTEEDAVDLLSMKNNTGRTSDFVDAIIIISRSPYLSESRKSTCLRNVWRRIYLHDSWRQIRDTTNKSDYELTTNLRRTQLYRALISPSLPRDKVLPPSAALQSPTQEEIEVRWPGLAPNQVYELHQDFQQECSALADGGPSDAEFLHVRKLADDDII